MDELRGRQYRRRHLLPIRSHYRVDGSGPGPGPGAGGGATISCWYCDFKISSLNQPLFRFGRKYAAVLQRWFSVGIGFSLTALIGVTSVLIWLLFRCSGDSSSALLFGFSPSIPAKGISSANAGYLLISTVLSVSVHELGHAVAAASEGIQVEYIAIFLAILFPGALVAFDHNLLELLPHVSALRIYSAGIWHNAVLAGVCGLLLFFLPLLLFPFYIHAEHPLVLEVSSNSPLSGFLFPGDVIDSLDGVHIHDEQEWIAMTSFLHRKMLQNLSHSGSRVINEKKGYCVPSSFFREGKIILVDYQSVCPLGLSPFVSIQHIGLSELEDMRNPDGHWSVGEKYCLDGKDIVNLDKCGDGWLALTRNGSNGMCSEGETCLSPVQLPSLTWVEIAYGRPYIPECFHFRSYFIDSSDSGPVRKFGGGSEIVEQKCGGTFVFVGDVMSMAYSVKLTAYQPRWGFGTAAYLPNEFEKFLKCTFSVSLTLALLNSMPVYLLDGESILEATLCHLTSMNSSKKRQVLRVCLMGGTIISVLAFLRVFIFNLLRAEE